MGEVRQRLTREQQLALLELLATCYSHAEAAREMKERFGIVISRQLVAEYDVANPRVRARMGSKLVAHFDEVHQSFLEAAAQAPIGNKLVRLRRWEELYEAAMLGKTKNYPLAAMALEAGAKETGGHLTKVEHSGTLTQRRQDVPADTSGLSDDELNDELTRRAMQAAQGA